MGISSENGAAVPEIEVFFGNASGIPGNEGRWPSNAAKICEKGREPLHSILGIDVPSLDGRKSTRGADFRMGQKLRADYHKRRQPIEKRSMERPNTPEIIRYSSYKFPTGNVGEVAWSTRLRAPVDPRYSKTRFAKTMAIDWNLVKTCRAGVIPYYRRADGKIRVCLGKDRKHGDITDWGGGVNKRDSNVPAGALRELREESHRVFDLTLGQLTLTSLAVYNDFLCVFFVPLHAVKGESDENELRSKLHREMTPKSEMSDMVWMNVEEFICLIQLQGEAGPKLYQRVKNLLADNIEFVLGL